MGVTEAGGVRRCDGCNDDDGGDDNGGGSVAAKSNSVSI